LSEATFAPLAGMPEASVFRPLLDGAVPVAEAAEPVTASDATPEPGQLATVAESLVKALEELAEFRGRLRERYERELLELALGVARKIVHEEVSARPEIWLGLIRAAVRRIVDRERITIRVPPRLLAFLRDRLPDLRASLDAVKEIDLVEDAGLPDAGCVIESRFGEVNLGIDAQLAAVEQALVHVEEAT